MNSKENEKLKLKIFNGISYLSDSYGVNWPIDQDALIFTYLSCITGGKIFIAGVPGLGKTTLAQATASVTWAIPYEIEQAATLKCTPELTDSIINGRVHFGKLVNKGEEEAVWSITALIPGAKIVDEINRTSAGKQNIIMQPIENGYWQVLNNVLPESEYIRTPFLAAINYDDSGTSSITPPLADRFNLLVELKSAAGLTNLINKSKELKERICDHDLTERIYNVINDPSTNAEYKREEIKKLSEEFARNEKRKDFVLNREDRTKIRKCLDEIIADEDAELFIPFLDSQLTYNIYSGTEGRGELFENSKDPGARTTSSNDNHYLKYMTSHLKNNIGNRAFLSGTEDYVKALAFLDGKKTYGIEELKLVLPYALAHRIKWKEEITNRYIDERNDIKNYDKLNITIFTAKQELEQFIKEEFEPNKEHLKNIQSILYGADTEKLEDYIRTKHLDHPYYTYLLHKIKGSQNCLYEKLMKIKKQLEEEN